ncbi:MAG: ABC transporter substrate-binding protein [Herpetosiphon sp.]
MAGRVASSRSPTVLIRLAATVVLLLYLVVVIRANQGTADPIWATIMQRGVLRVGTDPGFRPFAMESGGHWQGYDVDLAAAIAHRLHLEVQYVAIPYDALYDRLAAGDVDLLASALPLAPEQGWRARFSDAYLDAGQGLVARRGSGIGAVANLSGKRVGAALGSDSDSLLRNYVHANSAITISNQWPTASAALNALAAGDLDAVICDTLSGLSLTERDADFTFVTGPAFEPLVLALPWSAYALQSHCNEALHALRAEHVIEQLNHRWFASDAGGLIPQPLRQPLVAIPAAMISRSSGP